MSESGSVSWPGGGQDIWRLNYRLADSPDEEGIVVSNVFYRGKQVFYKASLPSLRVQYSGPCGPYKDPLNFNNAQTTQRCPSKRVCVYSYSSGGQNALALESFHRIGSYRLTHRWVFWENGWIMPRLYSAGLQCNYDHRHHAYWRFDFDIDNAANDLALEYNTYTGNNGWGPGWHTKTSEITRTKNAGSMRSWAVLDTSSGRGYHVLPGPSDGVADAFSTSDLWVLRYHGVEDRNGRQGSATADGLGSYLNAEDVNSKDVVLWYCGHLSHRADHGGDEWHSVGPNLAPFGEW
jgi:Cu2+-containing amine oxidase